MLSRKAAVSLFCKGIPHTPCARSVLRFADSFFRLPADSVPQEHIRSFKETIIGFLIDQEVILKLTAERKELFHRCAALKAEVKEAEQIRKGVYAILWEKNRNAQPTHKQDLDR